MVALSIGGFAVLRSGSVALRTGTVPGTGIRLTMRSDCLPLFLALAAEYHQTVARLRSGECGAYNYREAAGGGGWSDHAAGVAMDLNWNHEGAAGLYGGMSTMTRQQIRACAALKAKYGIVIWGGDKARGGDYSQPRYWDPMHYALKPYTTVHTVKQKIAALGIGPDGRPLTNYATRVVAPFTYIYDKPDVNSAKLRRVVFGDTIEYVSKRRVGDEVWLVNRADNYVLQSRTAERY